jgi:calcium-dependent protein kinase
MVAIKKISKVQVKNVDRFKLEIKIMKILDHPNIIKLFEHFEDHKNIYLVMELSTGGELFDRIIDESRLSERQSAIIMRQVFRALSYMHEQHIMHRDMKPENFLFSTKESVETTTLKLIDFGLSRQFEPGEMMTTRAGTPYYVAPQVLAGKYDHMCDLWSAGVIMYIMLVGYPPFYADNDTEVLAKVRHGKYNFINQDWKDISADAKELIRGLLKMSTKDRLTAAQALEHPWIKHSAPAAPKKNVSPTVLSNLRAFRSVNKLKKMALQVIAQQMNDDQIKDLRDLFTSLDKDGNGQLTVSEMREGIEKSGLAEKAPDLEQVLKEVDSDGSGVIDYTEWIASTLNRRLYMQEDIMWSAFKVFDRDGNGKISKMELQQILQTDDAVAAVVGNNGSGSIDDIMKEVDRNNDGEIDFDEFMMMMRGGQPAEEGN